MSFGAKEQAIEMGEKTDMDGIVMQFLVYAPFTFIPMGLAGC